MKLSIFGIQLLGDSTDTANSDAVRPTPNVIEPIANLPAQHLLEVQLRDLFNQTPGLETLWKACLMWRVNYYVIEPFIFYHDQIDAAEYRRYRQFYKAFVLGAEKPVADLWLTLGLTRTDLLGFTEFGEKAMEYDDRDTLDEIMANALRLFTEPEHANPLLDLNDKIERWKEKIDARDVLVTRMKQLTTKGSPEEKRTLVDHIRYVTFRTNQEIELAFYQAYIQKYKADRYAAFTIERVWERMITLVAHKEGYDKASALADELEKRTDVYSGPDDSRKSLREIRAALREILVKNEKYNALHRSMADLGEQGLLRVFYGAVHVSERFPKAEVVLSRMMKG
jgi:hypothetical protein